jgi:hypothetical protein
MEYKKCTYCREEKPLSEFGSNKTQTDGFHYYCKTCTNTQNKAAKYRHRYGISETDKEKMMLFQNWKCAICDAPIENSLEGCVDHDHKTGAIRNILCQNCNRGLGSFKDQPSLLRKAAEYLNRWDVTT